MPTWVLGVGVATSQLERRPPHTEWQHSTTSAGISYFPAR